MNTDLVFCFVLYNEGEFYDQKATAESLNKDWDITAKHHGDSSGGRLELTTSTSVGISMIGKRFPQHDIDEVAGRSYNWLTAKEDLADHTGHALITIIDDNLRPLEKYSLLTKVVYAVLKTSQAAGVFMPNQGLLITPAQFLQKAALMKEDLLPVELWVYIGLEEEEEATYNAYTFGLYAFGKQEFELENSKQDLQDIYEKICYTCSYVLDKDVIIKSGESLGLPQGHKIEFVSSEGVYVEGTTLKMLIS